MNYLRKILQKVHTEILILSFSGFQSCQFEGKSSPMSNFSPLKERGYALDEKNTIKGFFPKNNHSFERNIFPEKNWNSLDCVHNVEYFTS